MLAEISAELREASQQLTGLEAELAAVQKDKKDMEQFQTFSYDYGPADLFFPYAGRWDRHTALVKPVRLVSFAACRDFG